MSVPSISLPDDYVDLLREFIAGDVEFLLIGGWAVAAHGHGRTTDDMDVLIRASEENGMRVMAALERFGAPTAKIDAGLFATERYGYRIGLKPMLIELLTTIDGVDFDEAKVDAIEVAVGGLRVPVIGRAALLANKRASGRAKDLADVDALESNEP